MGLPRILFDLAPIVNPSFETGADGAAVSGWTDATDGINQIDTDIYHLRGSSEGVKSLRIESGRVAAGQKFYQDIAWHPGVGKKIAWVGVADIAVATSGVTVNVKLSEMNNTTVLATTTATITGADAIVSAGANDIAGFEVLRTLTEATGNGIRLEIDCSSGTAGDVWAFDYFHLGQALDFATQPFDGLDVASDKDHVLNFGGGAYEAVDLGDARTEVTATFARVPVDAATASLESGLQNFVATAGLTNPFAFWLDRDDHTNRGNHFETCLLLDFWSTHEEAGGARASTTSLRFSVPLEWVPQVAA